MISADSRGSISIMLNYLLPFITRMRKVMLGFLNQVQ
jgi:hypothetical protein